MLTVKVRYRLEHEGHVLKLRTVQALDPALRTAVVARLVRKDVELTLAAFQETDTPPAQVMISIDGDNLFSNEPEFLTRTLRLGEDIRQMLPMHVGFELGGDPLRLAWYRSAPSPVGFGSMLENPPAGMLE